MNCAVYVRISTELEQQKMSLEHQEAMFIKHIIDQGWTLYKVYRDIDTGTHGKRPGFIQMLEDAKENKFDIILAKELSRLVRNIGLSEDFKRVVMNNKIHVWTLDGAINTLEDDISKYGLYAWLYEEESRRTSNRIKDHMRVIAESGRYIKGEAPYGYNVDDGKLIPREDESPQVVRVIFKQYIDGHGFQTIARHLSDEGYQTPSMSKGKKNAGLLWHSSTIKLILKNRHYIGDLEQCKETNKDISLKGRKEGKAIIVVDTHDPIITKEDYYCVQKMMKTRATKHVERMTPKKHLFSDKLFCSDCDKKLWLIKQQGTYQCGTFKKHGANYCSSHKIKEDVLVDILKNDLRNYAKSMEENEKIYKEIEGRMKKQADEFMRQQKTNEKKRLKHREAKGKLILKYTGDEITKLEYDLAAEILDSQLVEVEKKLLHLSGNTPDQSKESYERIKTQLQQCVKFDEITRETVNRFVDKIIVHEGSKVEIHYKFNIGY